jgi:TPR repeat protein
LRRAGCYGSSVELLAFGALPDPATRRKLVTMMVMMQFSRLVLAVLVVFASSTFAASAQSGSSAEAAWQQAVQYIDANDFRDAIPLLTRAANAGHPRAQATLGLAYLQGDQGVPHDDRRAAYWLQRAAAQGHRAAQYQLGSMYEEGLGGLARNDATAARYYLLSARQGFPEAQFALGLSYEFGEGVPRNRRTAVYWLRQAAAQGDGRAGWTADWLRNPDTPQLQNEAQLGAYISRVVSQWYNSGGRGASAAAGPCNRFATPVACINAARENEQIRQAHADPNYVYH